MHDADKTAALLEQARALHRAGALAEAGERYRQLLDADPANSDARYYLAQIACEEGRIADGVGLLNEVLSSRPCWARALNLAGLALGRLGRSAEALDRFDRAIAAQPDEPDAHGHRGDVLAEAGRRLEAIESYDRALAIDPAAVDNWCNRGATLHELRRYDEAIASFDRVIALKPDFAEVHFNRGTALAFLSRYQEALAAFDRALAIRPDYTDALNNRAGVLVELKRLGEAIACYERLLAVDPDHPKALGELLNCHRSICDWRRSAELWSRLDERVTVGKAIVSPFVVLGISDDPAVQLDYAKRFADHQVPKHARMPMRSPDGQRRCVRLAYLSADFRNHATAYLAAGLFERHDRDRFEVIGISFGDDDRSAMRARLMRAFDQFHDVAARSDHEIAGLLQALGVDIAVDLKGHTDGNRLGALACRPVPIQVSYLGYPGTIGVDFFDYLIADDVVLPQGAERHFTEHVVRLPGSYQVNDSTREIAPELPSRRALGLPEQGFVFCSFNRAWKIDEPVFDVWMRLLRAVDGSVLWLFNTNETACANLRSAARDRHVDPQRLVFASFAELPEHLSRLRRADLFLDTLPCNAHTTASDALWAGVPVLTLMGQAFPGRVGASLLHAVGLPELVTDNLRDYETLALTLATDAARLADLRRKLEQNRSSHPLFDTDAFRRHIEAAYMTMWEIWQRGESPRSFTVQPIPR